MFESGDPEVVGTAIFCKKINDFFYCSNVRSRTEYQFKKNQQVKPYSSADDERFVWMSETFLTCLEDWQASIVGREGDFSATAQGHTRPMKVSSQNVLKSKRPRVRWSKRPRVLKSKRPRVRWSKRPRFYQFLYI